jgi:hypothetical protein
MEEAIILLATAAHTSEVQARPTKVGSIKTRALETSTVPTNSSLLRRALNEKQRAEHGPAGVWGLCEAGAVPGQLKRLLSRPGANETILQCPKRG